MWYDGLEWRMGFWLGFYVPLWAHFSGGFGVDHLLDTQNVERSTKEEEIKWQQKYILFKA